MPGHILYEGASLLHPHDPIVVLAPSSPSSNRKTGPLLQTYILRSHLHPLVALTGDKDRAICGECPHRPSHARKHNMPACYVNVGHGPLTAWRSYRSGAYSPAPPSHVGFNRQVRIGSYGDPCAVPLHVWESLISHAYSHTGYTHQWRMPHAQPYRSILMASVSSPAEYNEARSLGWRTYRIRLSPSDALLPNEFECPASTEQGHRLTCSQCMACNGAGSMPTRGNPAIFVHGPQRKEFSHVQLTISANHQLAHLSIACPSPSH